VSTDDNGDDGRHATVVRLLDDPALWAEVPPYLRQRVIRDADASVTPAPTRLRARRRPVALLAAAALVVVCLGVAGGMRLLEDDPTPAVEVALSGTEEAPGATATARLRDEPAGIRVVLDVSGLDPAPAGSFYEAWLVGEAGKVSAGTFHLRGAQSEIDLWLGVETEGYDAVTITRQPVAGGTVATGVVVLRGELPR